MNHFLEWDIIDNSVLDLKNGKMAVLSGFGLGFEINYENVNKAHELYLASIL
jgi:L-alanine-DL-glutamate epimerase-like enolase superfamily enzyme